MYYHYQLVNLYHDSDYYHDSVQSLTHTYYVKCDFEIFENKEYIVHYLLFPTKNRKRKRSNSVP